MPGSAGYEHSGEHLNDVPIGEIYMGEDWLARWREGRIGWHEASGSDLLRRYWPNIDAGSRVLVPLCGKSLDLLWLAEQGHSVTGIELSEIAIVTFFRELELEHQTRTVGQLQYFRCTSLDITLVSGDYFEYQDGGFDALYDRGSLVALPPDMRQKYVAHTKSLLKNSALQLLITLEYDQASVSGPPFAVQAEEIFSYWPDLRRCSQQNVINESPPKFRQAGMRELIESVWLTNTTPDR